LSPALFLTSSPEPADGEPVKSKETVVFPGTAPHQTQHPLVGRQHELLELQRLFAELSRGRGGLAMIGGEVGVGKTALVSAFLAGLRASEVRVFVGHCFDLETTPPYGPWLNSGILDFRPDTPASEPAVSTSTTPERQQILSYLRTHGPSRPVEVAAALGINANAATQSLRRLLLSEQVTRPAYGVYAIAGSPDFDQPELFAGLPDEEPGEGQLSRQSHTQQIWERLVNLTKAAPLVLVLEDMHWADQATVELLRYVARRVSDVPVLFIVTYRDAELEPGQPLYRYLPHIVREGNASRIALRRMNESSIRDLLAQRYRLSRSDEARLLRHLRRYTDGNAFFVQEVLLTMEQDRQLELQNGTWHLADLSEVHIPPLVQQVVDGRLDHLLPQDRQLLQIAAVIGTEVPFGLLADVSGTNEEEIIETIEHAINIHLLESVPGKPVVRFRHFLVREVLAGSMLSLRYQTVHRRVADTLLAQAAVDPDTVANHLRQANDPRAAEWLIRAGERAARQYAWIDAVERFQSALELMPPDTENAIFRGWLYYHIGLLSRRANAATSHTSLRSALEISEQLNDALLHGLSITTIGLIHCIFGEIRTGLEEISHGVQLLEPLDTAGIEAEIRSRRDETPLFVRLPLPDPASQRGLLIHWLAVAGHYTAAIEMGAAFTASIPPLHRQSEVFHHDDFYDAYLGLGHAFNMLARPAEAAAALDRVQIGYSTVANLPLAFLQFELMHLIYFNLDQASERTRVERLVTEIWESHRGMLPVEIAERFRPPRLLFWYGEWDEVERISRDWATNSTSTPTRLVGLGLGMIARHRGNLEEAWAWTLNALSSRAETEFGNCWCELVMQAHRLAADLALDAGELSEARRWIQIHADYLAQSEARLGQAQHHLLESRYHEQLGDNGLALEHAEASLRNASEPHQPLERQMAQRAVGRLLIHSGAYADAETHLAAAYELGTNCRARFEIAQTASAQALLMLRNGKYAGARHKLAEARTIATELDARPFLEELSDLSDFLTELTSKTLRPGGLSPRELDVLRLVAGGLTDAEIADRLFVSPRTVSGHLQSIYGKLNVSSRAAATAFAYTHHLI
jgi:DNA-binding CsgD family transcriptional regulator